MKKIFTPVLYWLASTVLLHSQALTFTRTYGDGEYDDARGIAATPDGGFVFTGLNKSSRDKDGSMYLTKVNAAGAVLWTQYYLRPEEDGGNHVLPASDGGYLISGHTALTYGINCDGFLVKTDARGNEQWRLLVGGAYDDICDAAVELPDGNFLVVGRTEDPETRDFHVLLAKVSPKGRVLFQKSLAIAEPAIGYSIARSTDGALFLAGCTLGKHGAPDNMLLIKCTADGEILWSRSWGSAWNERAKAAVPAPDGGCYVAGGAHEGDDQWVGMSVVRFNATGEQVASSPVLNGFGAGYLFGAAAAPDGRLAVAGVLKQENGAYNLPCYALLDRDLNLLDWKVLPLTAECRTRCVAWNPAGGFVLGGNEFLPGGKSDIFIAALSEQGSTLQAADVAGMSNLLFPNPFRDFTYLKTGEPGQSKTMTLSAIDGRVLRQLTFDSDEYLLQRGDLPAGTYFYTVRVKSGALLASGKLRLE